MSEGKRLDDVGGRGGGWLTLYSKKVRSSARKPINKRMSEGKRLDDVGGGGEGWLTRLPFNNYLAALVLTRT